MNKLSRVNKRLKRHKSVRKFVKGTSDKPRLSVYRSSKHLYAQIIDDHQGVTVVAEGDIKLDKKSGTKAERAFLIGKNLAEKALKKGIKEIVFDRGGYLYHGRVAKVAQGAREGGLKF